MKETLNNTDISTVLGSQIAEEELYSSLSTTALLAKNAVPYSHRKAADHYVIIKRIYKAQAIYGRLTNQEQSLLAKYNFKPLEETTLRSANEELANLKRWAYSTNDELKNDANNIIQLRSKELRNIVASKYTLVSNEMCNGYKALERYFEEITKFYK